MFAGLENSLGPDKSMGRHRYVGFLDVVPVATSALVLHSGVTGTFAVAPIPGFRRHGIGALMILAPLHEEFEMGYRIGTSRFRPWIFTFVAGWVIN